MIGRAAAGLGRALVLGLAALALVFALAPLAVLVGMPGLTPSLADWARLGPVAGLSAGTALAAAGLGTAAALIGARMTQAAARVWAGLVSAPLLLTGFAAQGAVGWVLLIGHIALATPIVMAVVAGRLAALDPACWMAARAAGARPGQVWARITWPLIRRAVAVGALAAALGSFALAQAVPRSAAGAPPAALTLATLVTALVLASAAVWVSRDPRG